MDLLTFRDSLIKHYPIRIDSIFYLSLTDSILSFAFTGLQNSNDIKRYKQTINTRIIFGPQYVLGHHRFSYYLLQENPFESSCSFACYEEPNGFNYKTVSDCSKVGIGEIKNYEKLIAISPNPSSGIFQIEIKNSIKPKILFIYDSKGDLVEQQNLSSKQNANSFSVQLNKNQKDDLYSLLFELESGNRILKKLMLQKSN